MRYQLPRPAIKVYEVGFLHAGGGIPCRPHPVATQLVYLQIGLCLKVTEDGRVHFRAVQLQLPSTCQCHFPVRATCHLCWNIIWWRSTGIRDTHICIKCHLHTFYRKKDRASVHRYGYKLESILLKIQLINRMEHIVHIMHTSTKSHNSSPRCDMKYSLTDTIKPGFHYPSWRAVNTARVDGPVLTGNGNRSPVNSGRQLG